MYPKCQLGLQSHLRPDWGRICFYAYLVLAASSYLWIVRWRTAVFSWILPGGCSYLLTMWAFPLSLLAPSKPARESFLIREYPSKTGYNLGHGIPSLLPYSIRRKPQLLPTSKGITPWGNTRRQRS